MVLAVLTLIAGVLCIGWAVCGFVEYRKSRDWPDLVLGGILICIGCANFIVAVTRAVEEAG